MSLTVFVPVHVVSDIHHKRSTLKLNTKPLKKKTFSFNVTDTYVQNFGIPFFYELLLRSFSYFHNDFLNVSVLPFCLGVELMETLKVQYS